MKICFATHNNNKLIEIRNRVGSGFEILSLTDLEIENEIPETGKTLEENSEIKARYVFDHLHIPVFADDTGLEVEILGNEPGVYSARYAGEQKDNEANILKLLHKMSDKSNRNARFKTVVTYISEKETVQFTGIAKGKILKKKRGNEGFGYDPVFLPDGETRSFAEMTLEEKNQISHRSQAFDQLVDYLNSL